MDDFFTALGLSPIWLGWLAAAVILGWWNGRNKGRGE